MIPNLATASQQMDPGISGVHRQTHLTSKSPNTTLAAVCCANDKWVEVMSFN